MKTEPRLPPRKMRASIFSAVLSIFVSAFPTCHCSDFYFCGNRTKSAYRDHAYTMLMYIYMYTPVYIYIYILPPVLRNVCLCLCVSLCGVGNKLRVSCKETRFYFCTQPDRFVLICVYLKPNCSQNKPWTHIKEHTKVNFVHGKISFQG